MLDSSVQRETVDWLPRRHCWPLPISYRGLSARLQTLVWPESDIVTRHGWGNRDASRVDEGVRSKQLLRTEPGTAHTGRACRPWSHLLATWSFLQAERIHGLYLSDSWGLVIIYFDSRPCRSTPRLALVSSEAEPKTGMRAQVVFRRCGTPCGAWHCEEGS